MLLCSLSIIHYTLLKPLYKKVLNDVNGLKKWKFGVPQESILGPTLHYLYTKLVSEIICCFNL